MCWTLVGDENKVKDDLLVLMLACCGTLVMARCHILILEVTFNTYT